MSGYHIYVLGTLCLVTITSIIFTFLFKKRLTNMTGMVLAMVTGMNVGLAAGVFFGLLFQGDLYYSTIVSILVGIIAGTTCGLVIGILPSLEGFMAGLMGGMMGAMLGEMITQNQAVTIVNVFLTLSVSSLLLFQILPTPSKKDTVKLNKKWILKPIITFILLGCYLLLGNHLNKQMVLSKTPESAGDDHKNHGSFGLNEDDSSFRELTINVHPSQFSYDPKEIIVKKDQPISLVLKNHDSIDHDIEIKKIPLAEKMEGHHDGHEANFHVHASGKEQTKITFTPLQKGTYTFYCTIPGHKENGMTGILIVQ